ncbi:LOW QUALITY PROTEIN: trophoblast glycoprotein [Salmo salar]|uniref:LOW QUALITY PROTEIN: trophoblast glycoprotein n=1 Tax=Salmo salar TaxID=8030 RepID=A0ABM3E3Z6_SALSA|nr:LOW QUALITY PROTEIN: trophoblast glycoprotein [Salmo salar]
MPNLAPLIVFFALLCSISGRAFGCPLRCECSEAAHTVKCVSKYLRSVPSGIPGYTRNLFITGNQISRIGPESFKGLDNLTTLSLSNNRITEVESQTFSGLRSLRSLDLSSNQLTVINPEAFTVPGHTLRELNLSRALYNHSSVMDLAVSLRWSTLGEIRTLDLSGNSLIYLPSHTFSYLGGLRRLILANNSLVALYNGTFSGLDSLEQLDLTFNALRTIQEEGLAELDSLVPGARLILGENPWTCICGIEPFAAWLNSSQGHVGDAESLVCAFPPDMRNISLLRVALGCHRVDEGADLALQTSYVFLGIVLGFVGLVFLLVLYLNRQGIKKRINDMREACTEVLEGYHYRYELDSDPRLSQVSTTADI